MELTPCLPGSLWRLGSHVLVAVADEQAEPRHVDNALSHGPNLALIERSALVSRLFVVPGKQVLHAREDVAAHVDTQDGDTPAISRLILTAEMGHEGQDGSYWDRWTSFYDYLVVLGTDPDDSANPSPDHLRILHNGRGFQLYRILKP